MPGGVAGAQFIRTAPYADGPGLHPATGYRPQAGSYRGLAFALEVFGCVFMPVADLLVLVRDVEQTTFLEIVAEQLHTLSLIHI